MKKLFYILLTFCMMNIISADPASCKFNWLLGTWISETEKTITTETWKWISENTLEGSSVTKNKSDGKVTATESMRLLKMEGEIFYLAKVKHNKLPIAFKMTQLSGSSSTFENPDHDFPTKLEYKLKSETQLEVFVSNNKSSFTVKFKKQAE